MNRQKKLFFCFNFFVDYFLSNFFNVEIWEKNKIVLMFCWNLFKFPPRFHCLFLGSFLSLFSKKGYSLVFKEGFHLYISIKKKMELQIVKFRPPSPPLSLSLQILQNKTTEFVLRCTSTPPLLKKKRCFYLYDYVCSNYLFPQNYLILLHFLVFSMFWVRTC